MKTFYKIICEDCNNIVDRSNKEIEHTKIPDHTKMKCDKCGSIQLKLWRSRNV